MHDYVTAVCADVAATARKHLQTTPLQTIFFGGGTPSLLPPAQLGRIVTALREAFGIAPDAEVSMEMDPGAQSLTHMPSSSCSGADSAASALCFCVRRHI